MFSFHEIGGYDIPASIDYILNLTGQKGVFYFGHSMGTTDFLAMVGTAPEYYDKIRLSVLLGPAAYSSRVPHVGYHIAAVFSDFIEVIIHTNTKHG